MNPIHTEEPRTGEVDANEELLELSLEELSYVAGAMSHLKIDCFLKY